MKIKKVELKDTTEENVLLPKTSLEMIDHRPLTVVGGKVQLGGEGNLVYVDSTGSNVNFKSYPGTNLTINGDWNIDAKQNIKIDGTPLFEKNINNASLKNFPAMSVFGLIRPSNANYAKKYHWMFGIRLARTSKGGEVVYETYGYCSRQQSTGFLVPGTDLVLLKDIDPSNDYVFIPLCSPFFTMSNATSPV